MFCRSCGSRQRSTTQLSTILNSRGATTLLINRTSGKGLIVNSTSANGPLFRNPFLTSTGWCEKFFHFSRPKKGVNLLYLFWFFLLSLITIYHNWPKNIKNTNKNVLVSIKPRFSDKFFNFYAKNSNFPIFRKVQIILKITKKLK